MRGVPELQAERTEGDAVTSWDWIDDTESLRLAAGIDGTPADAQDVPHEYSAWFAPAAAPRPFCGVCGLSALASVHRGGS